MPQKNPISETLWAVKIYREQAADPGGRDTEFQEKGRVGGRQNPAGNFGWNPGRKGGERRGWKGNFVLQGQPGDVGEPGEKVSAGMGSKVCLGISSKGWIGLDPIPALE